MKVIACFLLLCLTAAAAAAEELSVPELTGKTVTAQDGMQAELRLGPTVQFPSAGVTLDASQPFLYFGQYDCWAMVGTGTEDAPGVIGWIPAAAADMPEEPELSFEDAISVTLAEDAVLLDSFETGAEPICTLLSGDAVLLLAALDEYGYVQAELEDGTPVRGFVEKEALK